MTAGMRRRIGGIGIGVAVGIAGLFGAIFPPHGHEAVLGEGIGDRHEVGEKPETPFPERFPAALKLISRAHRKGAPSALSAPLDYRLEG